MEDLLYNLVWFVFLIWGLLGHYCHYSQMGRNLYHMSDERRRATEFSDFLWTMFSCQSKAAVLSMIAEKRNFIMDFVDHVLNEYVPETSIFSTYYLHVLLYRTKCQNVNTELQRKIDQSAKLVHMYFMLMVLDIKTHGCSTHAAYCTKFCKSFKTFTQLMDFNQYVMKINEIGLLMKEIHEKYLSEEDLTIKAMWQNMSDFCVKELQLLCVDGGESEHLVDLMRNGGVYEPSIPAHLLVDTI